MAVVGGGGGIHHLYEKYVQRPVIRVELRAIRPSAIDLEVENLSADPNSLQPRVWVTGYDFLGRRKQVYCDLSNEDRSLAPMEPKVISALLLDRQPKLSFRHDLRLLHFTTIRITPRKGRRRIVRLGDGNEPVTWWRHWSGTVKWLRRRRALAAGARGAFHQLPPATHRKSGRFWCRHCQEAADVPRETLDAFDAPSEGKVEIRCTRCGTTTPTEWKDIHLE